MWYLIADTSLVIFCGKFATIEAEPTNTITEVKQMLIDWLHQQFLSIDPHYPRCRLTRHANNVSPFYYRGHNLPFQSKLAENGIWVNTLLDSLEYYSFARIEAAREKERKAEGVGGAEG